MFKKQVLADSNIKEKEIPEKNKTSKDKKKFVDHKGKRDVKRFRPNEVLSLLNDFDL